MKNDGNIPQQPMQGFQSQAMSSRSQLGATVPYCCRIIISSSRWRTSTGSGFPNVSRMPKEVARSGVSR
jgi:hypothetical protein